VIMNFRKSILLAVVAVAFAAPGLSSATSLWHPTNQEAGETLHPDHLKSTTTRAEVLQALELARQDGTLPTNGELSGNYPVDNKALGAGKTRAEVQNELFTMSAEEQKRIRELYLGG
ncbi:MAG: DUF4148 domain-containing protein, partial [Polaromonas sp.]|nr:DUF4148 domain-containing protein [Polaromonas sp.]